MKDEDICFMDAASLTAEIQKGQLSALQVAQAFLDRIERVNPFLNAYVTVCEERALEQARLADERLARGGKPGLLHGIPVSVKDLIFTAGIRTTAGSRIHEQFIPEEDSSVVSRLKCAGAIILGKTNTPEFGHKATTENLLFGATHNPWKIERTPGGSSGGAAAATAAGLSSLSVGTDGGGSIRIPASFCGTFGLKPTFNLVPNTPGFPGWRSLSHTGPITRTVRDCALMLDAIAGSHELDRLSIPRSDTRYRKELDIPKPNLRLGYSSDLGFANVDKEVAQIVEAALPSFAGIGHRVEEVRIDLGAAKNIFETIVYAENMGAHLKDLEQNRELMDEGFVKFIERGLDLSLSQYFEARQRRDGLSATLAAHFSSHDLLLTPTVAVPPFPIGSAPREIGGIKTDPIDWVPFTYPFNLTGNPAATLPCGMTADGMPVGLQVVGPRQADGLVLNLCSQFEEVRPWVQLRPTEPLRMS